MNAIAARRPISSHVGARAEMMMSLASWNVSPAISQRA